MTTWNLSGTRHHVFICNGVNCMNNQAEDVTRAVRAEITSHGVDSIIHTTRTLCQGRCEDACVVTIYPDGIWYKEVTLGLAKSIVNRHLLHGEKMAENISYTYENTLLATTKGALGIPKKAARNR